MGETTAVDMAPAYAKMIVTAIAALKDRTGSSLQAIKKAIGAAYPALPAASVNKATTAALKKMVAAGTVDQTKGSYKLSAKTKEAAKKPAAKKSTAKKTTAKKTAAKKKPAAKKTTAKKKPAAKKSTAKKAPAKKAAKKPAAKKSVKAKKTPAKKAAKKPKSAKKNADMFKRSGDANDDGKVTRAEAKVSGKGPAAEAADLNNDGKVTRAEARALKKTKLA